MGDRSGSQDTRRDRRDRLHQIGGVRAPGQLRRRARRALGKGRWTPQVHGRHKDRKDRRHLDRHRKLHDHQTEQRDAAQDRAALLQRQIQPESRRGYVYGEAVGEGAVGAARRFRRLHAMYSRLLNTLALAATSLLWCGISCAESSLDQALEGFDEPAPSSTASINDALEGFDDFAVTPAKNETRQKADAPWRFSGATTLSTTWNYAHDAPAPGESDHRGLSRLRGKLSLELDGQLNETWRAHLSGYTFYDAAYALKGRDGYTNEFIGSMESEAELGEAFVQGRLHSSLDLKLGRQIVVWGKSDSLRVTDVINPLDNREPGMVDIEDLRLPLTMARADLYLGDWGLTALAIPEIRFNKNPAWGSDFYPTAMLSPKEITPEDGGGNTEYAFAANGLFSGWDL